MECVSDGTALPSPPKMQEGAFQVGLLRFCHSSVKKCYGCGQLLKMKGGDGQWHIPSAPNDLVIITATRRTYWQNGEQKRGHLGNVYFHCRVECEGDASSFSAFSCGHPQCSSTSLDASASPAPCPGITNTGLAGGWE